MVDLTIDAAAPADPQKLGSYTHSISCLLDFQRALDHGELRDWDALMRADPASTFFQGPAWCEAWYRSYADLFQPLTVLMTDNGRLVGVIPLAVERSTRRLAFAGDGMADYRDVVAMPGHRQAVILELLRICRTGHFPNDLQLGPIPPDSETLRILLGAPRGHLIVRYHSTWRWRFRDPETTKRLTSKESVRRHLSYYRRHGRVELERIASPDAWDRIKQDFFDQHSLRQLYTDRPTVFNQPRNRAFYDALFRKAASDIHLTALRVGDRVLAIHYGYIAKGVLYWGAPAFDIRDERHSPGQILLALLIQSAAASGLLAIDLTLGAEDFKKRFSNERAEVATVEIYARARRYYARRLRDGTVALAKASVFKLLRQPPTWRRIWASVLSLRDRAQRFWPTRPFRGPLGSRGSSVGPRVPLVYVAELAQAIAILRLSTNGAYVLRQNNLPDLLRHAGDDPSTAAAVAEVVKQAPDLILNGHTLHTLSEHDALLGWGWSFTGAPPSSLPASSKSPGGDPTSTSIHGLYVVLHSRTEPTHAAFLAALLDTLIVQGAERAYLVCPVQDVPLRNVIEHAGFGLAALNS